MKKSKLDFAISALLVAGMSVTPVLFIPNMFNSLRLSKELWITGVFVVVCTLYAYKLIWTRRARLRSVHFVTPPFLFPIGLFGILLVLHQGGRATAQNSVVVVLLFLTSYLFSFHLMRGGVDKILIRGLLCASIANAVAVLLQNFQIFVISSPYESYLGPATARVHLTGLMGNPNELGFFLACTALLAFHMMPSERGSWRYVDFAAGTLSLLGLLVTGTLTAIAAFLVASFLSLLFLFIGKRREGTSPLVPVGILLVGLATIALALHMPQLAQRRVHLQRAFGQRDLQSLLSDRYYPWLIGIDMARDRLLIGHGPGAYERLYFVYKVQFLERNPDKRMTSLYYTFAHNEYIQVLAELGGLGLIGLIGFFGEFLVRGCVFLVRPGTRLDFVALGLFAVGIATIVDSMAHYTFHTAGVAALLWVSLTVYARRISDQASR